MFLNHSILNHYNFWKFYLIIYFYKVLLNYVLKLSDYSPIWYLGKQKGNILETGYDVSVAVVLATHQLRSWRKRNLEFGAVLFYLIHQLKENVSLRQVLNNRVKHPSS